MATETYEMLQTADGNKALNRSSIYEWSKRFKDGHENLQHDLRSGCPSTSRHADTITNVHEMVT
jgi:hypothetical protein